MAAHTRSVVATSCAEAIADAIVLAHVGHGEAGATRLAARLRAHITETVTADDGTILVTVDSTCGTATSAAILG